MTTINKCHRRSIRLTGYDYAQAGLYYITICTNKRECLFGDIIDGKMQLKAAGLMAESLWNELPTYYSNIELDAFIVMPNHVHGVIILNTVGAGPRACPGPVTDPFSVTDPISIQLPQSLGQPQGVAPTAVPDVVHRFKSLTTRRYADNVKSHGWPTFNQRLWQRNYYEHIIRDDDSLNRIRQYIEDNPARWAFDRENPKETRPARLEMWE